jgi:hypothetical protein
LLPQQGKRTRKRFEVVVKRKALVVVAIISALTLTSCSQVNSAASVGNTEITLNTIQNSVNEVLKERAAINTSGQNLPTGQTLINSILQFHLYSALFDVLAKGTNITVTDKDIENERQKIYSQIGSPANLPKALAGASIAQSDFNRYMRTVLIVAKLNAMIAATGDKNINGSSLQKLVIAAADHEGVKVNPRYGVWNSQTGSIDGAVPNSALSK